MRCSDGAMETTRGNAVTEMSWGLGRGLKIPTKGMQGQLPVTGMVQSWHCCACGACGVGLSRAVVPRAGSEAAVAAAARATWVPAGSFCISGTAEALATSNCFLPAGRGLLCTVHTVR